MLIIFTAHYKTTVCIACDQPIKKNLQFFADVFHDDYKACSSIFFCANCGIGYTYPFLKNAQLKELYQDYEPQTHHEDLQKNKSILYTFFCWLDKKVFNMCLNSDNVALKKILTSFVSQRFFQTFPLYKSAVPGRKKKKLNVLDFGCGGGYFLL